MADYQISESQTTFSAAGSQSSFGATESQTTFSATETDQATASNFIFIGGDFDFDNNLWLDTSGNGNDLILKNASARYGDGAALDYTITGLLTTDTITVESGSDTPTIPVNGTLRIASGETVYGVTIKRAGVTWAVIPFCEPKPWSENMPTTSYDVSGNGHHATCAGLAAGNIVTQNNYFYLQRYGLSKGGDNLLDWDFSSWSGTYPDESPSGLDYRTAGSDDSYITEESGKMKVHVANNASLILREYSAQNISNRFRIITVVDSMTINTTGINAGMEVRNNGMRGVNSYFLSEAGTYYQESVPTNTTFQISDVGSPTGDFDLVISSIKVQQMEIIPALMDGSADALGNAIEIAATGSRWIEFACDLSMSNTAANKTVDQKGCWSDIILSGYCQSGETYLVEQTETDHFGADVVQWDEFVSDGTETCDRNNRTRQLILNSGERGLFFTDAGTQQAVTFSQVGQWHPHFIYSTKDRHIPPNNYRYEDQTAHWTRFIDDVGYTSALSILKSDVYVTNSIHLTYRTTHNLYEEVDIVPIVITWDHVLDAGYTTLRAEMASHSCNQCFCINYADNISKSTVLAAIAAGDEIILHSCWEFNGGSIAEWIAFHEISDNYTLTQLKAYYAASIAYFETELDYTIENNAYPGGQYDSTSTTASLSYFTTSRLAQGSPMVTEIPIAASPESKYPRIGARSHDVPSLANFQSDVDDAISRTAMHTMYAHPSAEWDAADFTTFGTFMDYVKTKQDAGTMVRVMTMRDAIDMIQKKI